MAEMTVREQINAAVVELKKTTQGYLKSNGTPRNTIGIQWKKGLDMLAQIGNVVEPPSPPVSTIGPFRKDGWLYRRIDTPDVSVMPNSAAFMTTLRSKVGGIGVNQGAWTTAVYNAPPGTPKVTIECENGWRVKECPDPRAIGFKSDAASDGWGVIYDPDTDRFFEFVRYETGTLRATIAVILGNKRDGAWNSLPGPWGAHGGSGVSLMAGLITPDSLKRAMDAGTGLGFCLAMSLDKNLMHNYYSTDRPVGPVPQMVFPASVSDGWGAGGNASVPMGSRFRLRSDFDISFITKPEHLALARTLKQHGCFVCDSTFGSMVFYAMHVGSPLYQASSYKYPTGLSPLPVQLLQGIEYVEPAEPGLWDSRAFWGGNPYQV